MLPLRWRAEARADLLAIIGYIAERNAPATNRLLATIEYVAERLPDRLYLHTLGNRQAI